MAPPTKKILATCSSLIIVLASLPALVLGQRPVRTPIRIWSRERPVLDLSRIAKEPRYPSPFEIPRRWDDLSLPSCDIFNRAELLRIEPQRTIILRPPIRQRSIRLRRP